MRGGSKLVRGALLSVVTWAVLALGCTETERPAPITTCPSGTIRDGDRCVPPSGVDGGDRPPLPDATPAPRDAASPEDGRVVEDSGPLPDTGIEPGDAGVVPDAAPVDSGVAGEPVPFWVDDHYVMSGYMGGGAVDTSPCTTDPGDADAPCRMITWTPNGADWAGFYFQHPENNWTNPGLLIAPGAVRVSFTVWGATGTESLNFGTGIRAVDGFQIETGYSILTTTPTRRTIELGAARYTTVAGAFAWFVNNPSHAASVTFYIDDIRWE